MPHLLLTRPELDARDFAQDLHALEITTHIEPMFSIIPLITQLPPLPENATIILTSQHALRILANLTQNRSYSLIVVGQQTAALATSLGFPAPLFVGDDSTTIQQYLCTHYPTGSRFFYLRGQDIHTDLHTLLPEYDLQEYLMYRADPTLTFSDTVQTLLPTFDGVVFFSRRTLKIFLTLLSPKQKQQLLPQWHGFCLSQSIAEAAAHEPWKSLAYPPHPNRHSLLSLLRDFNFTNA